MSRLALFAAVVAMSACSGIDVTKTAKGHYDPTPPSEVEILMTQPQQKEYFELGVVTADGFSVADVAKLHNGIREKAAAIGAQAVIVTDEGINSDGWGRVRWMTGVAIRWGRAEF